LDTTYFIDKAWPECDLSKKERKKESKKERKKERKKEKRKKEERKKEKERKEIERKYKILFCKKSHILHKVPLNSVNVGCRMLRAQLGLFGPFCLL